MIQQVSNLKLERFDQVQNILISEEKLNEEQQAEIDLKNHAYEKTF